MQSLATAAKVINFLSYASVIYVVVLWLVRKAAWWRLFTKAGECPWKALIPLCSEHILTRMCCSPLYYWSKLACIFVAWVCLQIDGLPAAAAGVIFMVAGMVLSFFQNRYLAKAFGRGAGFGVGLWLLHEIFAAILGFGGSQYLGKAAMRSDETA